MAGYEKGLQTVLDNIIGMANKEKSKLLEAAILSGSYLLVAAQENTGESDHSQKDLDSLGNPYSAQKAKDSGPHPDHITHIQTGKLHENIEQSVIVTPSIIQIRVGVNETAVPEIGYIIDGTSRMRPRDFLTDALEREKNNISATIGKAVGP